MTSDASLLLLVLGGGALGSVARWRLGIVVHARYRGPFPLGTFLINISGSFAIGLAATLLDLGAEDAMRDALTTLLLTGFLGGYTTFSSYELDTHQLATGGDRRLWPLYWVGSVVVGVAAAWAGRVVADLVSRGLA